MRLLLVINASASAVTPRTRVVIAQALAAGHRTEVVETDRRGHATELASDAAAAGWDAVVVLGGDGTLNEAANGVAGTGTALAVLPGGSTNVFARTIGTAPEPVEATGQLLAALDAGSRRRIGLGFADDRHFLFHLGIGFDAAVIHRVERRGHLKRYVSHPLFLAATVDTWLRHYDRSRPRFAIKIGEPMLGDPAHPPQGRPARGDVPDALEDGRFAVFLNSDPYTYLGRRPLHLAPGRGLGSELGVVAFRSLRLRDLLGVAGRALGSGQRVASHPAVWSATEVTDATVEGFGPFPFQVDGDYLGETTSLRVGFRPGVLDLIVPAL
ncbi:MAG TPA: diacylglycerol kinase family protein [Acidimicrobiales bacterium]|nr:diacylglycerol kinase family protein [Acidimicrobiales bacterium]